MDVAFFIRNFQSPREGTAKNNSARHVSVVEHPQAGRAHLPLLFHYLTLHLTSIEFVCRAKERPEHIRTILNLQPYRHGRFLHQEKRNGTKRKGDRNCRAHYSCNRALMTNSAAHWGGFHPRSKSSESRRKRAEKLSRGRLHRAGGDGDRRMPDYGLFF